MISGQCTVIYCWDRAWSHASLKPLGHFISVSNKHCMIIIYSNGVISYWQVCAALFIQSVTDLFLVVVVLLLFVFCCCFVFLLLVVVVFFCLFVCCCICFCFCITSKWIWNEGCMILTDEFVKNTLLPLYSHRSVYSYCILWETVLHCFQLVLKLCQRQRCAHHHTLNVVLKGRW